MDTKLLPFLLSASLIASCTPSLKNTRYKERFDTVPIHDRGYYNHGVECPIIQTSNKEIHSVSFDTNTGTMPPFYSEIEFDGLILNNAGSVCAQGIPIVIRQWKIIKENAIEPKPSTFIETGQK